MSTLGSLIVKIGTDVKDFTPGLDRVMKSTQDMGKFAATAGEMAGKALTAMGAAATAVGVNATRMAIDFESSFAGVKKQSTRPTPNSRSSPPGFALSRKKSPST